MGKEKTQTYSVIECNRVLSLSTFLSHFHFTVIEYFQFLLHYTSTTFYIQVFFTPLHLFADCVLNLSKKSESI